MGDTFQKHLINFVEIIFTSWQQLEPPNAMTKCFYPWLSEACNNPLKSFHPAQIKWLDGWPVCLPPQWAFTQELCFINVESTMNSTLNAPVLMLQSCCYSKLLPNYWVQPIRNLLVTWFQCFDTSVLYLDLSLIFNLRWQRNIPRVDAIVVQRRHVMIAWNTLNDL